MHCEEDSGKSSGLVCKQSARTIYAFVTRFVATASRLMPMHTPVMIVSSLYFVLDVRTTYRMTEIDVVAVHLQPQWPWCLKAAHKGPPFFPTDEVLSVIVAAVMGLQHALAMVGGIVTPPLIIGYLQDDPAVANCKRLTPHMLPHARQALTSLSRLYVIYRSRGSLPDRQWYLYLYSCKRLLNLTHAYCHHCPLTRDTYPSLQCC